MTMWVVPGAPLEQGAGWRIWYSQDGDADFRPQPVTVAKSQQPQPIDEEWNLLARLPEFHRRIGVLTVRLRQPDPAGPVYELSVPEAERGAPFRWRSLPAGVGQEGVTFLLASCFWRDDDKEGSYTAGVQELTRRWSPAFKLLAGDQLYADWPIGNTDLPAVEFYASRYAEYWGDALYRELLQTSPTFFVCDDHEFWNDFPERQIQVPRTWLPAERKITAQAGLDLYDRFQGCANPAPFRWYGFRIDPVSFFVVDSRSRRDPFNKQPRPPHFLPEEQWQDLERWVHQLTGPGVLLIGQPAFQKDGDWRDHSLSNFPEDYGRLWAVIEESLEGHTADGRPHDILVLSGDIHTGRFAVGRRGGLDAPEGVPELIASPASMIRPGSKEVEEPDYRFTVHHRGRATTWQVDRNPAAGVPFMTLANNVAAVRMGLGTNGRIRFELTLWQVRPYDSRSWWERFTGDPAPVGPVIELFRKEIELR